MSESKKFGSKKKKKIIISSIILMVIILAGIIWIKFFNSSNISIINLIQPVNQLTTHEKVDFDTTILTNDTLNNLKQFGPYPLTVKKVGNKNPFTSL